jgi:hypothetical protein
MFGLKFNFLINFQKVENVLIVQPHQHPFGEGTAMVTIYAMHVDSITK